MSSRCAERRGRGSWRRMFLIRSVDGHGPNRNEASGPAERDLRMDLLRGAALLFIHADHFQTNVLASLTPRNFGFSDMAEMFVFLSGCACGKSYGRLLQKRGF